MKIRFYRYDSGSFYDETIINRGVSSDPSCRFWKELWNTQSKFLGDGSHIGFSNGSPVIRGVLVINLVSQAEADLLRTFFTDTLRFIKPYSIYLLEAHGADLGRGSGAQLYECYVDGPSSTEDMITPLGKGGKFTVRIPYVCLDLVTIEGSFP